MQSFEPQPALLPVAILAGGLATRLRPLTDLRPKALIDINGQPFLFHQLRLLSRSQVTRVVMCVGHRGGDIQDFAGNGAKFGLEIEYSFDGSKLLGTAGAIRRAIPLLGPAFFVLYGDSYLPCDYAAVSCRFRAAGKLGLMTVCRNADQWDASNVEFSDGRILAYSKADRTPRMRHIDYGLGAFRSEAFDNVPEGTPWNLETVYQDLLKRGELIGDEVPGRFYEIGSMQGIAELSNYLAAGPPI